MMKKILSLSLCLLMILTALAGCAKEKDENDKGAYITMYLTDAVYNFDPAAAYGNESALRIVSLMFDNLFVLNENGKVKKSLAKEVEIDEVNNKMLITLNDTAWSDGTPVSANDVVYSWKRVLDSTASFEAAALLYDIENAREAKEGEKSIDDVRVYAPNQKQVEIYFNPGVDYDRFLLNLTSLALAPLREDIVNQAVNPYDWAKSASIFLASGPFKLKEVSYGDTPGLVLERNMYYYRNINEDALDEAVTPFRLIVDYSKSAEEIMKNYQDGSIFFVGDIPLSVRNEWKDIATVTDALSTHTYVLNENAVVRFYNEGEFEKLSSNESVYNAELVEETDGKKIFADVKVRQALSLAIDREAIANAVVFAKAATALVPNGVFETNSVKSLFRQVGGDILESGKLNDAKGLLTEAGVDPSQYMFAISVAAYDEVHVKIAEMVQQAWSALGFHVAVNAIDVIDNKHIDKTTEDVITGIKDDIFAEEYAAGHFEVAAIDYTALSADAFSVLAPFAKSYTGNAYTNTDASGRVLSQGIPAHISGYDSTEFNELIEKAYAEPNAALRAGLLHDAEKVLMRDLPVIPIIFNQNAVLVNENLSKYEFTYYGTPVFAKLKLKDYQNYIPEDQK